MVQKKVLLITGPGGSGKTTLAKRVAENKNWIFISEDSIWGEIYPNHESRNNEMQKIVIEESFRRIINNKLNVAFEFLVYTNPPNNVKKYKDFLVKNNIKFKLVVLLPSQEQIIKRKRLRGREDDKNHELNLKNIEHQNNCFNSRLIPKKSIITDSNSNVEEIYQKYIKKFIEDN